MSALTFYFVLVLALYLLTEEDDGNYFEKGPDGKLRLRAGKTKIDIDKLTADDLRALGIDPNMSKQDIARALKAKFGDSLTIVKGGQKVN